MKNEVRKRKLHVSIDTELRKWVKTYAAKNDLKMQDIVDLALREYKKNHK